LQASCRGVMEMPDEKHRLNLSLDMRIGDHRQAWEILSTIPRGRRTDAVCRMLVEHREQSSLQKIIRKAVREELQAYGGPPAKTTTPEQTPKAGAVRDDILGFLRDLQKEGDDD
jgi:hypothetical protein